MEHFRRIQQITIQEQPQQYAFPGEWFEIVLALEGADNSPKDVSNLDDLTLQTSLYLHDGQTPIGETCDTSLANLVVDSSTPPDKILRELISGDVSKLRCKIEGTTSNEAAIKFSVRIFLVSKRVHVRSIYTQAVQLVNYKLWVEADDWDDVWYKDEGGWDNCMQAQIQLRKADGSIALGRSVILHITIHYDDKKSTRVSDQNILNVLGGCDQIIRQDTGTVLIRFRVEDVSKNHQGNDFKLFVVADEARFYDVGSSFSPSFNVRSKKYRKLRLETDHIPSTDSKDQELKPASIDIHGKSSHVAGHNLPLADASQARLALNNIIGWADQVVNELSSIQWKLIGYESNPDGTTDYSKPIHESPNPNEAISNLITRYSSQVKKDLQVLSSAANPSYSNEFPNTLQGVISKSHTEDSLEVRESQVTYLLANNYHSMQNGTVLGYPAFNEEKHVIGFFPELSPEIGMNNFIPIHQLEMEFDDIEQENAAQILNDAIESHSETLYCISNYDSLQSLLCSVSSEFECKINPLS